MLSVRLDRDAFPPWHAKIRRVPRAVPRVASSKRPTARDFLARPASPHLTPPRARRPHARTAVRADFSETYKRTGPPPAFSPDGAKVATAVDHRLVLRDAETLAVIFMQDCVAKIEHIEWSNDSDHVLCAMYKKGKVQCFRASDDEWRCEVDEGPAGVAFAKWSPCGTRVLCVTEFKLRLSVWSLVDATCVYVKSPKFDDGRGLDFSPDGKFLAFVRRDKRTDSVLVVDARDWTVAAAFDVATEDLADARWSPDSTSIAVHDAPHANKGAMLYSPDGRLLGECEPDPTNVKTDRDARVGVSRQRWSLGGSFLAAGGRDRRCRVVNHVSWRAFADLVHADRVVAPATVAVYEETEERASKIGVAAGSRDVDENADENASRAANASSPKNVDPDAGGVSGEWWDDVLDGDESGYVSKDPARVAARRKRELESGALVPRYVVRALPASLPIEERSASETSEGSASEGSASSQEGVSRIAWSFDDRFLATSDARTPRAVWIWDMVNIELCAVLVQMERVATFEWDPRANRLAIVTGSERVYVWSPDGASFVQIPLPGFTAKTLSWNPVGDSFLLGDKGTFCCAFLG